MKVQRKSNPTETVKFSLWGADGSQEPRKVKTALETIKMTVVNDKGAEEQINVYRHESRTKATYYYANIGGKWMWTRDPVANAKYEQFKKPEPKQVEPKQKAEKAAKSDNGNKSGGTKKTTAATAATSAKTEAKGEANAPKAAAAKQEAASPAK